MHCSNLIPLRRAHTTSASEQSVPAIVKAFLARRSITVVNSRGQRLRALVVMPLVAIGIAFCLGGCDERPEVKQLHELQEEMKDQKTKFDKLQVERDDLLGKVKSYPVTNIKEAQEQLAKDQAKFEADKREFKDLQIKAGQMEELKRQMQDSKDLRNDAINFREDFLRWGSIALVGLVSLGGLCGGIMFFLLKRQASRQGHQAVLVTTLGERFVEAVQKASSPDHIRAVADLAKQIKFVVATGKAGPALPFKGDGEHGAAPPA